jgi:hypothetical protein
MEVLQAGASFTRFRVFLQPRKQSIRQPCDISFLAIPRQISNG